MPIYRCQIADCGRQMNASPPPGYVCPTCRSVDSYRLVMGIKKKALASSIRKKSARKPKFKKSKKGKTSKK